MPRASVSYRRRILWGLTRGAQRTSARSFLSSESSIRLFEIPHHQVARSQHLDRQLTATGDPRGVAGMEDFLADPHLATGDIQVGVLAHGVPMSQALPCLKGAHKHG